MISNSISRLSFRPGRLRFQMSSTPVPFAPPVLLVLLLSAPAGTVTSSSVPGWKAAGSFRPSSSSKIEKSSSGMSLRFSTRSR